MKWRVRNPFMFPKNKAAGIYLTPMTIFEATEEEVAPYRWMVEPYVERTRDPEFPRLPKRPRGRPPKNRGIVEPRRTTAY